MAVQHSGDEPTVEIDPGLDGPTLTIERPDETPREEKGSGSPWARLARRRWVRVAALALALVVAVSGYVVVDALSVPGADPPAAKLAEWARDHGLGPVVTWFEQVQYQRDQPAVGGTPNGGIPTAAGVETVQAPSTVLPPAPLPPLPGQTPLPGEGVWQTVLTVARRPAVQVTALRPDTQHTSFVVGVLRMDPTLIRGQLHPGTRDPGGNWHAPSIVAGNARNGLAVAFNGGFRLTDPSHPGYYSEGRTAALLVPGQASLVLHTDGTADVGTWNQEVQMSPTVASVRQNLQMLLDHGDVNPACATGGTKQWGSTIGQAAYIHRSGFGVTGTGVEVYVGGPALSVCTLGNILKAAGVVRGLELDINPNWVSGTYFHPRIGAMPQGYRLFPDERVSPQHYLTAASSRDFYTWSTR
jgi:hypothetical protein